MPTDVQSFIAATMDSSLKYVSATVLLATLLVSVHANRHLPDIPDNVDTAEKCTTNRDCHGELRACAGPPENLICVAEMTEGKRCVPDPYWACKEGLDCVRLPGAPYKTCQPPNGPKCYSCYTVNCEAGEKCRGPECNKKCVKPPPKKLWKKKHYNKKPHGEKEHQHKKR